MGFQSLLYPVGFLHTTLRVGFITFHLCDPGLNLSQRVTLGFQALVDSDSVVSLYRRCVGFPASKTEHCFVFYQHSSDFRATPFAKTE